MAALHLCVDMLGNICKCIGSFVLFGTTAGMAGFAARRWHNGVDQNPLADFEAGYNLTVLSPYILPHLIRSETVDEINVQVTVSATKTTVEVIEEALLPTGRDGKAIPDNGCHGLSLPGPPE